jgi:hypothetical protein
MQGLLGCSDPPYVQMVPVDQDNLLRFFDLCSGYDRFTKQVVQEQALLEQQLFPALAKKLTSATGIHVKETAVEHWWELCAFQVALFNKTDEFCSLFTGKNSLNSNIIVFGLF